MNKFNSLKALLLMMFCLELLVLPAACSVDSFRVEYYAYVNGVDTNCSREGGLEDIEETHYLGLCYGQYDAVQQNWYFYSYAFMQFNTAEQGVIRKIWYEDNSCSVQFSPPQYEEYSLTGCNHFDGKEFLLIPSVYPITSKPDKFNTVLLADCTGYGLIRTFKNEIIDYSSSEMGILTSQEYITQINSTHYQLTIDYNKASSTWDLVAGGECVNNYRLFVDAYQVPDKPSTGAAKGVNPQVIKTNTSSSSSTAQCICNYADYCGADSCGKTGSASACQCSSGRVCNANANYQCQVPSTKATCPYAAYCGADFAGVIGVNSACQCSKGKTCGEAPYYQCH